ncbi:MAG: hypothetical protein CL596_01790 [Alteromonas sp.]|nr:hypothetical protein [Alteromonas sp.]
MKPIIHLFFIAICNLLFFNCAGGKDFQLEKNPPSQIRQAYFQKWIAGVQGGGSGTNVHFVIELEEQEATLEALYFQNEKAALRENPNKKGSYTANFLNESNRDVIMDESPVKESQNTPPEKIPFDLLKNEAVISYTIKGQTAYYKVENLEEKPLLAYPSTNPNGID